jgi:hypothetical protein
VAVAHFFLVRRKASHRCQTEKVLLSVVTVGTSLARTVTVGARIRLLDASFTKSCFPPQRIICSAFAVTSSRTKRIGRTIQAASVLPLDVSLGSPKTYSQAFCTSFSTTRQIRSRARSCCENPIISQGHGHQTSNKALQPTATRSAFTFFMIKTVQEILSRAPGSRG